MLLKRDDKKLIIISVIVLIGFFIALGVVGKYYTTFANKGLVDFCNEKCGELDLAIFNNHTDFLYIECGCVEDVDYYFDSITMEEITREEVDARIVHG